MTESEYIDATNLAKIRAAKVIFYDALEMSEEDECDKKTALQAMRRMEARIEARLVAAGVM